LREKPKNKHEKNIWKITHCVRKCVDKIQLTFLCEKSNKNSHSQICFSFFLHLPLIEMRKCDEQDHFL